MYARRIDQSVVALVFHCTDTHIYVFPLSIALSVVHNKYTILFCCKADCRKGVFSGVPDCTDTHIYIFPVPLALSVVHNKNSLSLCLSLKCFYCQSKKITKYEALSEGSKITRPEALE